MGYINFEHVCKYYQTGDTVVKAVDDPELQTLLELRYLCFKDWPDIACEMHCSESNVYKVHSRALQAVRLPKLDSKLQ